MVLTVTPNPALDKTYLLDSFTIDRLNRPRETQVLAGGKGVNVARAVRRLGGQARATGFLGGHVGREVRHYLAEAGIRDAFIDVPGETRLCLAFADKTARTLTEVNENGPSVPDEAVERLVSAFPAMLEGVEWVALCGSLPPGVSPGLYRDLIGIAREHGARTLLDSSGDALRMGLEARPDVIKPNAVEVTDLLGREIETVGEAAVAGRELVDAGASLAVITLGRCGAVAVDASGAWYAEPPEVEFRSAVGSGDSFVAGLVTVLRESRPTADAVRYATAAGAANVTVYGAGCIEKHVVENIAPRVTVTPIEG